jgi:cystathionine gamma-synthase
MKTFACSQKAIFSPDTLGRPLPDSMHAVSVSLPSWQDVVGYEEKHPRVMERLRTGYPRFVIHPWIQEMGRRLGSGVPCLPFPSVTVASQCADFIRQTSGADAQVVTGQRVWGVTTSEQGAAALKAFWQHTGMIVSSRQAEAWMAGRSEGSESGDVRVSLRRQLADLYGCEPEDVFLMPTGMAAHYAALRAVLARSPGRPTVQLGFPYVDTLKLQQKIGCGGILLHRLDRMGMDLRALLGQQTLAGCFSEIPGNPLLGSANLQEIRPILREHGVPLIADDVVATPYNVDLSAFADLVATSLTKFIVGTGDVMGGAVICNPQSPFYRELHPILEAQHEELLWGDEATILDRGARTFAERMRCHNEFGQAIALRLRQHPAVERVWYPQWEFAEAYEAVRRPTGGYGALVTFLPRRAEVASPRIYDALECCKGPSLGNTFTLACPFTLLAHYSELEWAESCGVSRYLIRLSVGLEDPEELWKQLTRALDAGLT